MRNVTGFRFEERVTWDGGSSGAVSGARVCAAASATPFT